MEKPILKDIINMKTYMVGGAVRDRLLGRPVHDRDFVVVGASVDEMLEQGYRQVGKAFPVFLHPKTGEEYALARVERRIPDATGNLHTAFEFVTKEVSLEEDLSRRDLTINAMAQDEMENLVDPYGGQSDLKEGWLRHVSDAFAEDPLRVLRVARFAARYQDLGFKVHPQTLELMKSMVDRGDLNSLTPERVWGELQKALTTASPSAFIRVLHDVGALAIVLPEVEALYGVPQPAEHHPEVDTGLHLELVLDQAAALAPGNDRVGFAALVHDLGKALTPEKEWPRHIGHEENGEKPVRELAARLRVPNSHMQSGVDASVHHLKAHKAFELRAGTLISTMMEMDAFRQPIRWETFVLSSEADARGRAGLQDRNYPQSSFLREAFDVAKKVKIIPKEGEVGPKIAVRLFNSRISAVKQVMRNHAQPPSPASPPQPASPRAPGL